MIIPPTPLTDAQVVKTLTDMEDVIRYRVRLAEIIPVEMFSYRIGESYSFSSPAVVYQAVSGWPCLFQRTKTI